jgi:hypothetical protein
VFVLAPGDLLRRFDRARIDDRKFSVAKMRQHLAPGSQSATRLSERQNFPTPRSVFRDITLPQPLSVIGIASPSFCAALRARARRVVQVQYYFGDRLSCLMVARGEPKLVANSFEHGHPISGRFRLEGLTSQVVLTQRCRSSFCHSLAL